MDKKRDDPLIGKIFFKTFKVRKMLGEGSFGKIYIAINLKDKEECAVKLVTIIINNCNLIFNNFRKKKIQVKVY